VQRRQKSRQNRNYSPFAKEFKFQFFKFKQGSSGRKEEDTSLLSNNNARYLNRSKWQGDQWWVNSSSLLMSTSLGDFFWTFVVSSIRDMRRVSLVGVLEHQKVSFLCCSV